ncbi:hypothetical protein C8Q69DRAFT_510039 [Paecilomyces variotii]|uniref:Uncharacterized protein n=1 Tax=Byssochlamys spectabilis TaxID=264951 RepID=A0A443HKS3_BYSSP|nr:hypothetical protein C8Q69DRAFT_510039 [Paecilomyces variotii]RWQ92408.1 hypothetical protein C8Q69DRAFT_510039 [Paecilomyces variotii]
MPLDSAPPRPSLSLQWGTGAAELSEDAEWFLEPAQFVATFGKGNYTAVTDGQLRTKSGKTTSAIVEVKAGPRIGCSGSKKL